MTFEKRFLQLRNKYYPKLKHIELKKRKQDYFMIAPPFSKHVYYNETIIKKCNPKARDAAFIHELYHKQQFARYNPVMRLLIWIGYFTSLKVRIKIEREAHTETVKKGFGEGTILLNKFVKSRYSEQYWNKEHNKLHLSEKEIRKMIENKKIK